MRRRRTGRIVGLKGPRGPLPWANLVTRVQFSTAGRAGLNLLAYGQVMTDLGR